MKKERSEEEPIYLSPLKLIYSAYTDERPIFSAAMEKGLEQIDGYISELTKEDRNAVFRIIQNVYQENERLAFLAGVQSGVRLMEELSEI